MRFDLLSKRFPSKSEIYIVFCLAVFFVYSWSIREFLYNLPSFMLYLSILDMLSVLCYMLAIALVESILIACGFVILGFVLPRSFLRNNYTGRSFLILLVGAAASIYFQKNARYDTISIDVLLLGFGISILILLILILLNQKLNIFRQLVKNIVDGLTVFAYFYVPMGIISMVIVIARNLFKG